MARWNGEDYKTYEVNAYTTFHIIVPPGCAADMRAEYAAEKAEDMLAAGTVDWAIDYDDIHDITREVDDR